MLTGQRIVVTGGTGSLGSMLVRRLLSGDVGHPASVTVFSRDEAKQHSMRLEFEQLGVATDEVIFRDWRNVLRFSIGDIRDKGSVSSVLQDADIVFNAAALKQVPTCEYFPMQALQTNVIGPDNIVRVISEQHLPVHSVVGISTDKACKPVNVMGMTKALQERVFIHANLDAKDTRFVAARYGNVMASRGSVIPLFLDQAQRGGPLTITTTDMTRFMMNLDQAVDTILAALTDAKAGEIYIPRVPSAKVVDVATAIIDGRPIATQITGIRPGEKVHELLVSEEESPRTVVRGDYYVIKPMLPELLVEVTGDTPMTGREYSSSDDLLDLPAVRGLLRANGFGQSEQPVVVAAN